VTAPDARPFRLESGVIAAELSGSPSGRLVGGIPGLSANLRSFLGASGEIPRTTAFAAS